MITVTIKNMTHDQLAQLRKSSPANTKLSVSRKARSHRNPTTYVGTGNIRSYVKNVTGIKDPLVLTHILHRVESIIDYTGETPDAYTIKNLI
jgi:hypothetical protein